MTSNAVSDVEMTGGEKHSPTDSPNQVLLAVVGPTGVGKTASAVSLCKRVGGEIIGADSIQVYRGFDIGSAKPTTEQLGGVPHHLIDVCQPDDELDAMRYAKLADAAIAGVLQRGHVPVLVGGTGLWIRALLRGLVPLPPVDEALRRSLIERWQDRGPQAMHDTLRTIDPLTAGTVHPNDQLRVVRALEVHAQTGEALGELRRAHALGAPRYRTLSFFVDVPPAHYRASLETRTDAMIAAGWPDEVRAIVAAHGRELRALGSVGYRQVLEHVTSAQPLAETRTAIVQATAVYARRQRTWFKSDPTVSHRMTPAELLDRAAGELIDQHMRPDPA